MQRRQPDDMARYASHGPGRIARKMLRNAVAWVYSCTNAGAFHPRPVEHAGSDYGQQGWFPLAWRHMGPHHYGAWAARLMLTVLGGLAEFERELIRTRTGEGRARAVARGQRMGRPPKLTSHQRREAIKRRDRGEESLADIGRSYNGSGATISRLVP
jgi:hypothetical protein